MDIFWMTDATNERSLTVRDSIPPSAQPPHGTHDTSAYGTASVDAPAVECSADAPVLDGPAEPVRPPARLRGNPESVRERRRKDTSLRCERTNAQPVSDRRGSNPCVGTWERDPSSCGRANASVRRADAGLVRRRAYSCRGGHVKSNARRCWGVSMGSHPCWSRIIRLQLNPGCRHRLRVRRMGIQRRDASICECLTPCLSTPPSPRLSLAHAFHLLFPGRLRFDSADSGCVRLDARRVLVCTYPRRVRWRTYPWSVCCTDARRTELVRLYLSLHAWRRSLRRTYTRRLRPNPGSVVRPDTRSVLRSDARCVVQHARVRSADASSRSRARSRTLRICTRSVVRELDRFHKAERAELIISRPLLRSPQNLLPTG